MPELTPDRLARRDAAIGRLNSPIHADEIAAAGPPEYPALARALAFARRMIAERCGYVLTSEMEMEAEAACVDWPFWSKTPPLMDLVDMRLVEVFPEYETKCYVLRGVADGLRDDIGAKGA